jgi:hypothetical protein
MAIFFCNSCQNPKENSKIIGVKIYDHQGDLNELFNTWSEIGINLILSSPELARKDNFMQLARSNSISVFLILPTFFNTEALGKDSSLYAITSKGKRAIDDWVHFVCPNREDYRRSHIEYIKNLTKEIRPDGISIDFIRYFVFWEQVFPGQVYENLPQTCFDEKCLAKFKRAYTIEFPDSCDHLTKKADYILTQQRDKWVDFKCKTIADFVEEMVEAIHSMDPTTEINFHAVPWRSKDFNNGMRTIAGQDLKRIAPNVDYISPMCYSHMVKQPPEWIHEVVNDFNMQVPGSRILPSIQVSKAYLNTSFSEVEFKKALSESLKPPSEGVIFWSWEALEKSPEKLKIVKDYISENY